MRQRKTGPGRGNGRPRRRRDRRRGSALRRLSAGSRPGKAIASRATGMSQGLPPDRPARGIASRSASPPAARRSHCRAPHPHGSGRQGPGRCRGRRAEAAGGRCRHRRWRAPAPAGRRCQGPRCGNRRAEAGAGGAARGPPAPGRPALRRPRHGHRLPNLRRRPRGGGPGPAGQAGPGRGLRRRGRWGKADWRRQGHRPSPRYRPPARAGSCARPTGAPTRCQPTPEGRHGLAWQGGGAAGSCGAQARRAAATWQGKARDPAAR
jgi:hypothetical protein